VVEKFHYRGIVMQTKTTIHVKPESAITWVSLFPGLIWSIEVPRSRLEIIKDWHHPDLGENTALLLKDTSFGRKQILPEDYLQIIEFWEAMTAGKPANALFRLAAKPKSWIFLQGWPDVERNWFYHGTLQPAPEHLLPEMDGSGGERWHQCRSVAKYPVLLIDSGSGMVVDANQEAGKLLGKYPAKSALSFESLLPRGTSATARLALETAVGEGVWGGSLTLKLPNGLTVNSETRLTSVSTGNKRLVRLTFLNAAGQKRSRDTGKPPSLGKAAAALVRKVSGTPSLLEALELMLSSHEPHAFDGIIYSDIHGDKGYVTVYGAGKPFADLWEQTFAYDGTIAQNIEHHGLNFLVVDDTLESIKSIDWVLFVPRSIRSYFARPFYRHNRLRAVLILCSLHPNAFPTADAKLYEVLAPAFEKAVFRSKTKV
jgi:hypothetical protein